MRNFGKNCVISWPPDREHFLSQFSSFFLWFQIYAWYQWKRFCFWQTWEKKVFPPILKYKVKFYSIFVFTETSNRNKNVNNHFMVSDFAAPNKYKNAPVSIHNFLRVFSWFWSLEIFLFRMQGYPVMVGYPMFSPSLPMMVPGTGKIMQNIQGVPPTIWETYRVSQQQYEKPYRCPNNNMNLQGVPTTIWDQRRMLFLNSEKFL